MAKKNFKDGLDNLLSTTGMQKIELSETNEPDTEIPEEIKQFFIAKIARLKEELALWRSGVLTREIFLQGLEENNLSYDSENDRFILR